MSTTDQRHASRGRDIFLVAICFALATGVIEAAIAGVRILVVHRFAWVSPDVAWMTPLATLLFFLPVALLMAVLSGTLRRAIPLGGTVAVFAFLGALSLLLPYEQVARWASAILALGVALQFARLAGRSTARALTVLRGAAAVLASWVVVSGAGVRGWRAWSEHRAMSRLAAPAAGAPNVLLVLLDTVRRANLHLYGYARATTPELDRRVPESLVFDRAMSAAPWTLPSHASLFTGRRPGSLTADWRTPLSAGPRTLAEVLASRGYATGGFVANLLYTSYESGLARGFAHYDDYPFSLHLLSRHAAIGRIGLVQKVLDARSPRALARALRQFDLRPALIPANEVRTANSVTDAFLAWQRDETSRPFFAFLNYFDAHKPYRAPEPYTSLFLGRPQRQVDRYDGAIAWVDHEVGRLLDSLQRRGVLDRTIVIVVSDHGDQFGEHALTGHANSLYLPLLEVPLLIRYPAAVPAGTRVGAAVTLRDVAATVLDLAGVAGPAELPGSSLARYWRTPATAAPSVIVAEVSKGINVDSTFPNSRWSMRSILDEQLHFIQNGWGRDELYAWRTDSLEAVNLVGDSARQGDLRRLRQQLDAARRDTLQPR